MTKAKMTIERAIFALGALAGSLNQCTPSIRALFLLRSIRRSLIAALRLEGHEFTETRFDAWFAGLTTLSDEPRPHGMPAKALCGAVLNELAASDDDCVSEIAGKLLSAFYAPADLASGDHNFYALAMISAARTALEQVALGKANCLSDWLATIYEALQSDALLALAQARRRGCGAASGLPYASYVSALELQLARCSPTWMRLPPSLLLPGLINRRALDAESNAAREMRALGFLKACEDGLKDFQEARQIAHTNQRLSVTRRTTSRVPTLLALISAFGPMRSKQLETALRASRLGVQQMIQSLDAQGAIARHTISGSHLYGLRQSGGARLPAEPAPDLNAFSSTALADYDHSLAELDNLLNKSANSSKL